jgi:uncharacterized MAPEG superfamily protein
MPSNNNIRNTGFEQRATRVKMDIFEGISAFRMVVVKPAIPVTVPGTSQP